MKKMLVQTHFFSIALLLSVASGCSKNDEKSTFVFVEYVEVSGTCKEDHANKSGKYFGSLVKIVVSRKS